MTCNYCLLLGSWDLGAFLPRAFFVPSSPPLSSFAISCFCGLVLHYLSFFSFEGADKDCLVVSFIIIVRSLRAIASSKQRPTAAPTAHRLLHRLKTPILYPPPSCSRTLVPVVAFAICRRRSSAGDPASFGYCVVLSYSRLTARPAPCPISIRCAHSYQLFFFRC